MTPRDLVLTPRGIRFMGRYFPCSVGRGGVMRDKREGDGATHKYHMTIAAICAAARNVSAHRKVRRLSCRQSLRRLNMRSMMLRDL